MSCPQDSYYTTETPSTYSDGRNTCGACGENYGSCSSSKHGYQPNCCPSGWSNIDSHSTGCNSCYFAGVTLGKKYLCAPNQPTMTQQSQINCCLGQNLPNNTPNGYCATGWCPNSDNCISFMTNYCQGNNLKTDECIQFCRSNLGKCDQALINYCADSSNFEVGACGCALPSDQYLLAGLKTPDGEAIPITCDRRCDVNKDAIRLQGQQDCDIKAICVVDLNDVKVVSNEIKGSGIKINQNCGNSPSPSPSPSPSSNTGFVAIVKKYWYIILIFIIIIVILILVLFLSNKEE